MLSGMLIYLDAGFCLQHIFHCNLYAPLMTRRPLTLYKAQCSLSERKQISPDTKSLQRAGQFAFVGLWIYY